MPVRKFLSRIHAKLGDLWWYTILLFVAQRFGDVINMFVGLWIVPKYVPMEELGAVLPLTNVVGVIGIPLSIVAIPFLKFVAVMMEKGETGKAKAFVRDTFVATGVFSVLSILVACFVFPFFFERLRVQNGSLAFLLVVITVLTAVSTISMNAVGALRLFSSIVWLNALAAPLRLLLVVVLMPFRALTGYVAGGLSAPLVNIGGAWLALRRFLCSSVRPEPYWRDYGRNMLVYSWPLILMTVVNVVGGNVDTLVIRHRLSEFESAGYYMITRFSDISIQFGSAFMAFVFPMLANRNGRDGELRRMVVHSSSGVLGLGLLLAVVLWIVGEPLLSLKAEWSRYVSLVPEMVGFAISGALSMACVCITTAFIARSLFSFLWYLLPVGIAKCAFLYALTGYGFFQGILPDEWMSVVETFNPCRLSVVMWILLGTNCLTFLCLIGHALARRNSAG